MTAGRESVEPSVDTTPLATTPLATTPLATTPSDITVVTTLTTELPQAGVANLANALTVARLVMVPIFTALLLSARNEHTGWRLVATGVFVVASLTDRVDGAVARRRGTVTDFGKIADPIADKALIGAALISLSSLSDLPWWVTIVVLTREIGVTALRFWVIRRGVLAASRGGKVKTVLQTVAIGLYLLPLRGPMASVRAYLMAAAIIITLVTGVDYVARAVRLRRLTAGRATATPSAG